MLKQTIHDQQLWMDRCGGSVAGYVRRFGSMRSERYGNAGELFWAADMAELIYLYSLRNGIEITFEDAFIEIVKKAFR